MGRFGGRDEAEENINNYWSSHHQGGLGEEMKRKKISIIIGPAIIETAWAKRRSGRKHR